MSMSSAGWLIASIFIAVGAVYVLYRWVRKESIIPPSSKKWVLVFVAIVGLLEGISFFLDLLDLQIIR